MRRFALMAPLALLWVMTAAIPEAGAYQQWSADRVSGNCAGCHGDFRLGSNYISFKDGTAWGRDLHDGHRSGMLSGDCNACHQASSRFPVILDSSAGGIGFDPISCMGCHGRNEDAGGDGLSGGLGRGLRQHHQNANVTLCAACHTDSAGPPGVGENVMPPYYFTPDTVHVSKPTDACDANGSESVYGPTGLDNDGDLLDDAADPHCADNAPPVADANGPYSGTVGVPVTFDGTGSNDPDGTIVAYDWDFGDGNVGTGQTPTHTYAAAGSYAVTLTVTDDGTPPLIDTATTTAEIGIGNIAPTADANGPYTGTVGVPVTFDGTGSSDDGAIVAYDWDFGDGGVGTGPTPTHTYASDGVFNVILTVTDDGTPPLTDSATATATIDVLVPPVADADGPYGGVVGQPVIFDGSGSTDPDGTIVAYDWDFGDGNTGLGVSPSHTYAAAGAYTVTLTVTDDDGLTDSNSTTAAIDPDLIPPIADANGPYSGTVGVPVSFDGTGSIDPDGTIVAYDWDFGDGNVGTGPTPTHTYAVDGVYTVSLTVTDDDSLIDSGNTTATITVVCAPPTADPNGPYIGMVGSPVQFNGSGSVDPCYPIVSYDWDFGDGNTGTGVSPMYTYAAAGLYNVTLTVTNDRGLADSGSTTATISDVPPMAVSVKVPAAINPANNGVTPVNFWADTMDLNIAGVTCGPAMAAPERLKTEDVNDDGYMDAVGLFRTGDLGIACGDMALTCQGTLVGDGPFTATSSTFKTVGSDCKPPKKMAKRGK